MIIGICAEAERKIMSNNSLIYLDYAATTPVAAEVIAAAMPYFGASFYNPSSLHMMGQMSSMSLRQARRKCLSAINGHDSGNIIFTSGGTEAINQAIKCSYVKSGEHIVISAIEHDAVFACAEKMKERGVIVDVVDPTANGIIEPSELKKVMCPQTKLVCVMLVNNIVGTIQPIKVLAEVAHEYGALFFTDAVQAVNSIDINVKDLNVDMLCVSGHKFYAPKGSGFLYVKNGVQLGSFIDGGSQESGLRGGTVDVPSAMALATAITMAQNNVEQYNEKILEVTNAFVAALNCGEVIAKNSNKSNDILSIAFDGVNGGRLAVALSVAGVCCSVGSACSAGSAVPPQTLLAMRVKNAESCVRFSFGSPVTVKQAIEAAETVNETVAKLKSSSDNGSEGNK